MEFPGLLYGCIGQLYIQNSVNLYYETEYRTTVQLNLNLKHACG